MCAGQAQVALVTGNDERIKGRTFSGERLEGEGEGGGRGWKSGGYVRRERNPEKKVPGRASGEESGGEARTMKGERAKRL